MSSDDRTVSAREQELLLGYLLGALEETEARELEGLLRTESVLRRELERLRACLEPLAADKNEPAPPGLAARTCEFVADQLRPMAGGAASASLGCDAPATWTLRETVVAAVLLISASMVFFPAVGFSRFHAEVVGCQNNLRHLGNSLVHYAEYNGGHFPAIPLHGKGATPGFYAAVLRDCDMLDDGNCMVCPSLQPFDDCREPVPTAEQFRLANSAEQIRLQNLLRSYGYTLGVSTDGKWAVVRNLRRSTFPLMADAPSSDLSGQPSRNHGDRGFNMLFEDGRVQFFCKIPPMFGQDNCFLNDGNTVAPAWHVYDSVIAPCSAPPGACVKLNK